LNLSRLSHGEMRTEKVDLSLIAETVVSGLRKRHPERRVDVKISPGMEATADAGLIHVVLENLLDNAWKFTGKKSQATVEFGVIRKDGKNVYFVRDNGAGFDMAYIDKLFGPFQRLHTINEFPGTGVGLAIVQRVIRRHGGRVWAEGEVEQGATFYFTLPPEETPPPENKGTD
jgi:light-regulated signal transduction histidine kinase (bacteriophytochrome)